ncbi:MAG: hypothetical protein AABX88_00735 [Nanoarchaeota archaeon]
MKKGLEKKGQFYLIAAIVIIAVLFGFVSNTNFSKKRIPLRIENLGEELDIESQKVLDYAIYNGANKDIVMNDFTKKFSGYSGKDTEIYYIIANNTYEEVYSFGDSGTKINQQKERGSNEINVTVNGTKYNFELNSGENFYFIMVKSIGGEQQIITNA